MHVTANCMYRLARAHKSWNQHGVANSFSFASNRGVKSCADDYRSLLEHGQRARFRHSNVEKGVSCARAEEFRLHPTMTLKSFWVWPICHSERKKRKTDLFGASPMLWVTKIDLNVFSEKPACQTSVSVISAKRCSVHTFTQVNVSLLPSRTKIKTTRKWQRASACVCGSSLKNINNELLKTTRNRTRKTRIYGHGGICHDQTQQSVEQWQ